MRRAAKVDRNHAEVVRALRAVGIWAHSTAGLGNGFPDVLACRKGVFVLLEVKDGEQPPSKRRLTDDEAKFFDGCPGPVFIVTSPTDAIHAVANHCANSPGRPLAASPCDERTPTRVQGGGK